MSSTNTTSTPADQVEALVQRHFVGRGHVRDFRVLVQEQGLVLQGCASTYFAKQLAEHVIAEITGLSILANEIKVL